MFRKRDGKSSISLYICGISKMDAMTEQKKYAMQQEDDLGKMAQSIPLPILQYWYDRAIEDYNAGRCVTITQLDSIVKRHMGWI